MTFSLRPRGFRLTLQRSVTACIGALLISTSVPTLSDDQSSDLLQMDLNQLLNVRITGSHLRHVKNAPIGPITVINRETIARSGAVSLEVLLQQLSVSAGYAGNQTDAYWATNGWGNTNVNLRGLGINRTLLLLNGHRLANGGTGANVTLDLNSIPLALVDRVEIFRDGASAIYGADAVAGVVNIITRQPSEGVTLNLHYGQTSQQDGAVNAASITWGVVDTAGSLSLNLSHDASDPINMATRASCGLGEVNGQLVCVDSGNTIGGRAVLADGTRVNFNQIAGGDGNFYEPYSASKHNFNVDPYLNAVNPIERTSLSALGNLVVSDDLKLIGELIASTRNSEQLVTPGTIGLNRPIFIAADNPTNPTGQDLRLQRRRLLEAGARNTYEDVSYLHGLVGFEGHINERWDWQASLNWSRNTGIEKWANVADLDRVDQTLNPSVCGNAAVPCGDYLGYGDLTPQVLDYIMKDYQIHGGNQLNDFNAGVNGILFELPAGPLAVASGLELRSEHAWRHPDAAIASGVSNANREQPVSGKLAAREVFVEADLPVWKNQVWAESLVVNAALRYSNYDIFGDTTNYKLGINWQLGSGLGLRVSRSSAFRAPNIPELFSGEFTQNIVTQDPCSDWSLLPADSLTYQNCRAAGVPAGYQQLVASILTTQSGNRALKPESATTNTLGIVWSPETNSTLSLSLDYFNVSIDQSIVSVDGGTKLAACYNSVGLTHPFCSGNQFTRNAQTGEINYLSGQLVNAANEQLDGVDLGVDWVFNWDSWRAKLNWQASYLRHYELQPFKDADSIQYAGYVAGERGSYMHWRSLGRLTVEHLPWSGMYSLQYLGSADNLNAPAGSIGAHQPSVTYHNVQMQYQINSSLKLALGVDNLLDQSAPFVRNWLDVNTDTMTYDVAGRRWFLSMQLGW